MTLHHGLVTIGAIPKLPSHLSYNAFLNKNAYDPLIKDIGKHYISSSHNFMTKYSWLNCTIMQIHIQAKTIDKVHTGDYMYS